ncbi:MAG: peptidoglycan-binding protein, partial [Planctomycetes bacterium]|nr:peptidoglycan-binding protein [Planctomycetota bacterium]
NVASPIAAAKKDGTKELQEALKSKGFYNGEVDGAASAALDEAVKAFKVANKLKGDAIVGPKVKELLGLK